MKDIHASLERLDVGGRFRPRGCVRPRPASSRPIRRLAGRRVHLRLCNRGRPRPLPLWRGGRGKFGGWEGCRQRVARARAEGVEEGAEGGERAGARGGARAAGDGDGGEGIRERSRQRAFSDQLSAAAMQCMREGGGGVCIVAVLSHAF